MKRTERPRLGRIEPTECCIGCAVFMRTDAPIEADWSIGFRAKQTLLTGAGMIQHFTAGFGTIAAFLGAPFHLFVV